MHGFQRRRDFTDCETKIGCLVGLLTRTHFRPNCHCERSMAISLTKELSLSRGDCHVASLLAMTKWVRMRVGLELTFRACCVHPRSSVHGREVFTGGCPIAVSTPTTITGPNNVGLILHTSTAPTARTRRAAGRAQHLRRELDDALLLEYMAQIRQDVKRHGHW